MRVGPSRNPFCWRSRTDYQITMPFNTAFSRSCYTRDASQRKMLQISVSNNMMALSLVKEIMEHLMRAPMYELDSSATRIHSELIGFSGRMKWMRIMRYKFVLRKLSALLPKYNCRALNQCTIKILCQRKCARCETISGKHLSNDESGTCTSSPVKLCKMDWRLHIKKSRYQNLRLIPDSMT